MISKLVESAVNKRLLTLSLIFLIACAGIWSWIGLKKEAYPDVGDTQVTVMSAFPGKAAEEVELQVTRPLERVLNSVPKVIVRRSKTIFGLSSIQLTFEDGVNDYFARQLVLEKLHEADLPDGVEPELAPLSGPVGEILRYVIEAPEQYTPMDLRTLQDWTIIPKLLQVPGVADVITFGGLVKQFHVITSPDQLAAYNFSIQDVIDGVQTNNRNTGGNILIRGGQGLGIRGIGAIRNAQDIENIVLDSRHGIPIFIKNIGSVETAPMQPSGILGYILEGKEVVSGVQGLIAMRRGENPSDVVNALKEKIAQIQKNLPEGVKIHMTYDRSELVSYTIDTVSTTIFEGISLVVIFLIFFIGSLRTALVVAMTIPLSLLFAFLMMRLTGIPANLLSLGAIDFGIIVDGAVVMAENIMRHYKTRHENQEDSSVVLCTILAAKEVSYEIFFAITIIISAYFPIFMFQRVEGKLFSPMAYTLAFALLGSMLLALTLIPVMMSLLFKNYHEWKNPVYGWIETHYTSLIYYLTSKFKATLLISFALVVLCIGFGASKIGTEFLPDLDEGALNIRAIFPAGISLAETNSYTHALREQIKSYKAVDFVITQAGRNEDGTEPYNPNRLEILVGLKDYALWKKEMTKDELTEKIQKNLQINFPGVIFSFSQPILDNVTEAVTGSVADLAIQINGDNLIYMRSKANEILDIVKKVPGASEFGIEQEGHQAQLVIDINRSEAARFGININDIQTVIEAAIGAAPISTLYEDGKQFGIVVRYSSEQRGSLDAISNIRINSPSGAQIPIRDLASLRLIDGETLIQRQDGHRQVSIRSNIRGRDQGSFVAEAQKALASNIKLKDGYSISWGGQFENLTRAAERLKIVVPLTLFMIFLLLYSLYRDGRQVMVALSCIPFAIAGGLIALLLRGYNLNVSAGVGFISLFGISTMSGVLFVSRMRHLQKEFPSIDLLAQVRLAAQIQFRPRLTTVLPALLGLIPAALASGIGSDVQRPMATVIVGGLASGLILTLTTLPSLCYWVEKNRKQS
ncbi:MAG: CusA/CzcA family heavy metal efflux RND transporter [Myxococcaceae bacterium]